MHLGTSSRWNVRRGRQLFRWCNEDVRTSLLEQRHQTLLCPCSCDERREAACQWRRRRRSGCSPHSIKTFTFVCFWPHPAKRRGRPRSISQSLAAAAALSILRSRSRVASTEGVFRTAPAFQINVLLFSAEEIRKRPEVGINEVQILWCCPLVPSVLLFPMTFYFCSLHLYTYICTFYSLRWELLWVTVFEYFEGTNSVQANSLIIHYSCRCYWIALLCSST